MSELNVKHVAKIIAETFGHQNGWGRDHPAVLDAAQKIADYSKRKSIRDRRITKYLVNNYKHKPFIL